MPLTFPGFSAEALRFFRQLKRNNNREWFLAHKEIYEKEVKAPMVELVLALGVELQRFAPEMVTDPKRAIYRIYRDIRFSHDKTPYKTHIAAVFAPRGIPKHAGGGFYFHISPQGLLIAGGAYMPRPKELLAMRNHIALHGARLRKIIEDLQFKKHFGLLDGEKLSRVPKGFPADHPAADLLRYKQFLVSVTEPPELALRPELLPRLTQHFHAMAPLVQFLNSPLKQPLKGVASVYEEESGAERS